MYKLSLLLSIRLKFVSHNRLSSSTMTSLKLTAADMTYPGSSGNGDLLKEVQFCASPEAESECEEILDEINDVLIRKRYKLKTMAFKGAGAVMVRVSGTPNAYVRDALVKHGFTCQLTARREFHCRWRSICDYGTCVCPDVTVVYYVVGWNAPLPQSQE